jgi:hypothetical protein
MYGRSDQTKELPEVLVALNFSTLKSVTNLADALDAFDIYRKDRELRTGLTWEQICNDRNNPKLKKYDLQNPVGVEVNGVDILHPGKLHVPLLSQLGGYTLNLLQGLRQTNFFDMLPTWQRHV